jgi:pyruvate kinase
MRKTKIICTLGPAVDSPDMLRKLLLSGANAVRLNFAHGRHEEHLGRLSLVRQVSEELRIPVATILDTKGPEIRIRTFNTDHVTLEEGAAFTVTTDDIVGDQHRVSVTYPLLHQALKPGNRILLDDGLIELLVSDIRGHDIGCVVVNGGILSSNKSINIPDVSLRLQSPTEQDVRNIHFAVENGMDFIAASFIRSRRTSWLSGPSWTGSAAATSRSSRNRKPGGRGQYRRYCGGLRRGYGRPGRPGRGNQRLGSTHHPEKHHCRLRH